jgi:hypothetical protein
MEVLRMRGFLLLIAAAVGCVACGLFLDDLSKGSGGDASADSDTDTDTETDVPATPCDGVDLEAQPCCNIEDTCLYSYFPECDCPTCSWDAIDCGAGDGGVPDAGA